jgi:hypothetical protein
VATGEALRLRRLTTAWDRDGEVNGRRQRSDPRRSNLLWRSRRLRAEQPACDSRRSRWSRGEVLLVVLELELGPAAADLRGHDGVELMDGDDDGVLGGERRRCARKIWQVSRMRAGSCVREDVRRRRPIARR